MQAVKFGSINAIKWFISKGANVNALTPEKRPVLHVAVMNNDTKAVAELISAGANVNGHYCRMDRYHEDTAIIRAAVFNCPEAMALLIKYGADINYANQFGDTALMESARFGHTETTELLLKAHANVNARGFENVTALILACKYSGYYIGNLLINAGADVNASNCHGETPLTAAIERNRYKTALALVYAGANVEAVNLDNYPNLKTAYKIRETMKLDLKYMCRKTIRNCLLKKYIGVPLHPIISKLDLPVVLAQYVDDI